MYFHFEFFFAWHIFLFHVKANSVDKHKIWGPPYQSKQNTKMLSRYFEMLLDFLVLAFSLFFKTSWNYKKCKETKWNLVLIPPSSLEKKMWNNFIMSLSIFLSIIDINECNNMQLQLLLLWMEFWKTFNEILCKIKGGAFFYLYFILSVSPSFCHCYYFLIYFL